MIDFYFLEPRHQNDHLLHQPPFGTSFACPMPIETIVFSGISSRRTPAITLLAMALVAIVSLTIAIFPCK